MNKYRREVSIEILVGLFMFIVLIALGIFTIVLSHENLLKKSYSYEFVFPEIGGLREGDNVFLRGKNVGRVKQTSLEADRVRVYATLEVPLVLRHGYKIEIVDASMLGGKTLKIYEGPGNAAELGGNITLLGAPPVNIIEELAAAVKGFQSMIDSVSEGQGTLGKLMKDESIYNNLVEISEGLKEVVGRVERGEGSIGKLLADNGQMYEDGKSLMANLSAISQDLADGKGTLGQLVAGDSTMLGDLEATMASAKSISKSIDNGEGTLGKLVRDAKLYDETTLLVEDVRAAIDDLREASPITSFGSVLFGAF